MIISEVRTIDNVQYNYYYSDEGRYIVWEENGAEYEEVYDPIYIIRAYTEGDLIPTEDATDEPTESEFAEAGRIMMAYEHSG